MDRNSSANYSGDSLKTNNIEHKKWTLHLPAIAILLLGVVFSVFLFLVLQAQDRQRIQAEVARKADSYAKTIEFGIANSVERIDATVALYNASQNVTRDEFSTFASRLLENHSEMRALEWIPYVTEDERALFENAARQDGLISFNFTERTDEGALIETGIHPEYYPVYFIEPLVGNEAALGFDMGSSANRREAMERARDTGSAIATTRVRLVMETKTEYGFIVFHPVFEKGVSLGTLEDRSGRFLGFVAGVYGVSDLIRESLRGYSARDFTIFVEDSDASAENSLLHIYGTGESVAEQAHGEDLLHPAGWTDIHLEIRVPGRRWSLHFIPTRELIASIGTSHLVYGSVLPFILASGVGGFVYAIQRRRLDLENINIKLSGAKSDIERELTVRRTAEEALRMSEERYRTTLGNMLEGCQIIDFEYRYFYLNDVAEEQSRKRKDELIGRTMAEIFPGIENTEMFAILRKCMEQRAPQRMENLFTYPDGLQRYFELSFEPVPEGVFILSLDITERKQAEQALIKTNRALKMLSQCNQTLVRSSEESRLLDDICRLVVTDGGYTMAWVGLLQQDEHKILRPVAWQGYEKGYLSVIDSIWADTDHGGGPVGTAIRTGQSYIVGDTQTDHIFAPWRAEAKERGYASLIALPLVIDAKVFGVLCIYAAERDAFQADELELLGEMANDLSFGIMTLRVKIERDIAEENMRTYLEMAPDGVYIMDAKGTFLYFNKRAEEISGYRMEEVIGKSYADLQLIPDEYQDKAKSILENNAVGKGTGLDELVFRRKNGSQISIEITTASIKEKDGYTIIGIIRDITERKRMEEHLRQSEEKLRLIFQTTTCGIVVTDLNNVITDVNNRTLAMYGAASKGTLIGKSVMDFVSTESRERAQINTEVVLKQGYLRNVEYNLIDSQGKLVPVLLSIAVLKDAQDRLIGFVTVIDDITELRRMQEQLIAQDRLVSVGELVSGVAHELNNPLTGIIGFAELLMEKDVPENIKNDLKVINDEAQRTARIVKNLLTFARQQKEEKQPIDINEVIQRVLDLRAHDMKVKNIQVDARLDPALPPVLASASQLQQVFFNIVINAEFFMLQAHQKGVLTIITEQKDGEVRVSIADDGPGIKPEHLMNIFDPFYTTKGVGKGTGLGLSISHGIITEHGGSIMVESEPGGGANFIIDLPIYQEI